MVHTDRNAGRTCAGATVPGAAASVRVVADPPLEQLLRRRGVLIGSESAGVASLAAGPCDIQGWCHFLPSRRLHVSRVPGHHRQETSSRSSTVRGRHKAQVTISESYRTARTDVHFYLQYKTAAGSLITDHLSRTRSSSAVGSVHALSQGGPSHATYRLHP